MLRISERYFSVTIPAGTQSLGFKVGAPYYGLIKRLTIKQTAGASVGATVNLYDRPVVATTAGGTALDTTTPTELAAIIPKITFDAGAVGELATPQEGYAYRTTYGESQSRPSQEIYLHIAQGSDPGADTTWMVCLVIAEPL